MIKLEHKTIGDSLQLPPERSFHTEKKLLGKPEEEEGNAEDLYGHLTPKQLFHITETYMDWVLSIFVDTCHPKRIIS